MTPDETKAPRPTPRSAHKSLSQLVLGYEVGEELGRGGMGVVFKARQVSLDRTVALKMILSGGAASAEDLARFRREARTLATLQHPHVVQIHDSGDADGLPWFALEFCTGGTLSGWLKDGPLPVRKAVEIVATLAEAVAAVHRKGIIHRDLKPGNVLFTGDGVLKVADFGLVREGDGAGTMTGATLGTPAYMAPEQALGQKVDARADVYALGAILYECLAGRPPYIGPNGQAVLAQVMTGSPPVPALRLLRPEVPAGLAAVCVRCLERDVERRCGSAAEMASALREWLADEAERGKRPKRGSGRGWLAVVVGVVVLLAVGVGVALAWWMWGGLPVAVATRPEPTVASVSPTPTRSQVTMPALLVSPFDGSKAKAAQEAWRVFLQEQTIEKEIEIAPGATMTLVLIPAGTFTMGLPKGEANDTDETPHEVTIPRAFWLGKYEVTQAQYEAAAKKNPSKFSPEGEYKDHVKGMDTTRFPVENVLWDEADIFCAELGKRLKQRVTLPTEAQWEWACRAGTTTPFHFGKELNGTQANCDGNFPFGTTIKSTYIKRTTKVGSDSKYNNAFGLADMHGNVSECCRDWSAPSPATTLREVKDSPGFSEKPENSTSRVHRGGSWDNRAVDCRTAVRFKGGPAFRFTSNIGFRVCLLLD